MVIKNNFEQLGLIIILFGMKIYFSMEAVWEVSWLYPSLSNSPISNVASMTLTGALDTAAQMGMANREQPERVMKRRKNI